jgi:hypothetical protein
MAGSPAPEERPAGGQYEEYQDREAQSHEEELAQLDPARALLLGASQISQCREDESWSLMPVQEMEDQGYRNGGAQYE